MISQTDTLRVAVVGAGAFGRNHLRVYSALAAENGNGLELSACVDPDPAARHRVSREYGIRTFDFVESMLSAGVRPDAVSVCTPTVHHVSAALPLLAAGVDLLVEKPIAPTLAEADAMLAAAQQHGRMLQVGHLERFNPAVVATVPLIRQPMFFESHRLSVFTPRSLDVDVVLDLMIHDLDIVLTLANSPVREVRAVGLPVLSQKTDIANVRVEFESGAVANFTASRISTERVRKLRIFQPHQYLSLDFARQDLLMIDVTAAASLSAEQMKALFAASGTGAEGQSHPSAGLSLRKLPTKPGEPLRLEIESFLHSVRTRTPPVVSGENGRAALALALEINAAIEEHAERAGLRTQTQN